MSSNNVSHLITRTITTLQTLRYISPHFTQLHFTALIDTSLPLICVRNREGGHITLILNQQTAEKDGVNHKSVTVHYNPL
jgi:hypothetical protein